MFIVDCCMLYICRLSDLIELNFPLVLFSYVLIVMFFGLCSVYIYNGLFCTLTSPSLCFVGVFVFNYYFSGINLF